MGRYLASHTPADEGIYPPFINFTEIGPTTVRVMVRGPKVFKKLPGRGEELFPDSGGTAQMDIDKDELKKLLTQMLEKLYDE